MKVLFAVHDEKVSLSIVKKYQKEYKEIISYKNVYYFNAILKELQRDKTYDRIVIDEELEEFTSTSYEQKDKFIFDKLDHITDEASNINGNDMPIILICSERRVKSEEILVKLFGIGIYNAMIGNDRSTDEVCRLINQPRSKKEAKIYYKIDAKDVNYDPEGEDDVSEEEMQHILSYFKKLGKNEEKYVECFERIVSQYNQNQLKVIISILPLHVRSVLEESSAEYQKIVSKKMGPVVVRPIRSQQKSEGTSAKLLNANEVENKSNKPIVVPSKLNDTVIKKVSIKRPTIVSNISEDDFEDIEEDDEIEELEVQQTPKRRGRPPKKEVVEEDKQEEQKPKRRGRPPKKKVEEIEEVEDLSSNVLPGFDDVENEDDIILPGFEDTIEEDDDDFFANIDRNSTNSKNNQEEQDVDILPGFEDIKEDEDEEDYEPEIEPEFVDKLEVGKEPQIDSKASYGQNTQIKNYSKNYDDYDYSNYNNLLSSNRKVIAFVGTSKNGTSFIVNNIAKILSESGINTAILDATQNKNAYYIYNNNDDSLRQQAANAIENLIQGVSGGIKVKNNLSVYVEVPGQESNMGNVGPILENLAKNHSAVLIDCDFNTPVEYFANAQEIFLVQSMDVLTIQPLTAFLKELKNRDILEERKLRIIINKAMRLKGITPKQVLGGMSNYNNPEMSIMTELFDRNSIVPIEIPFDVDVYAKYLESLADCEISINKYPKEFQVILKKLSSVVYPLLPAKKSKQKPQRGYQYASTAGYSNGFSNSVNNTLNNMKNKY